MIECHFTECHKHRHTHKCISSHHRILYLIFIRTLGLPEKNLRWKKKQPNRVCNYLCFFLFVFQIVFLKQKIWLCHQFDWTVEFFKIIFSLVFVRQFLFFIFFSSIRFIISSFESQRTNEADEKNIIILWLVCSRCLNSVCHSVVVCRFYFCREYIVTKSLTLTVRRVCLVILLVFFYTYFFCFCFWYCVLFFLEIRVFNCVYEMISTKRMTKL